jgi:hypothetical protein
MMEITLGCDWKSRGGHRSMKIRNRSLPTTQTASVEFRFGGDLAGSQNRALGIQRLTGGLLMDEIFQLTKICG